MFYFLLFTGTAMILSGMRGMKKKRRRDRRRYFAVPEPADKPAVEELKEEDQEMISNLTDRMAEMEKSLFEHHLKWQMEKEELLGKIGTEKTSFVEAVKNVQEKEAEKVSIVEMKKIEETKEIAEKTETEETAVKDEAASLESKKKPMPDHIRKVMDYEKEGLSIQEIANVTRMNKGEVLLLKNLSKHYRK